MKPVLVTLAAFLATPLLAFPGQPAEQAARVVTGELQAKYPDWANATRLEPAVRSAFNEAP